MTSPGCAFRMASAMPAYICPGPTLRVPAAAEAAQRTKAAPTEYRHRRMFIEGILSLAPQRASHLAHSPVNRTFVAGASPCLGTSTDGSVILRSRTDDFRERCSAKRRWFGWRQRRWRRRPSRSINCAGVGSSRCRDEGKDDRLVSAPDREDACLVELVDVAIRLEQADLAAA